MAWFGLKAVYYLPKVPFFFFWGGGGLGSFPASKDCLIWAPALKTKVTSSGATSGTVRVWLVFDCLSVGDQASYAG